MNDLIEHLEALKRKGGPAGRGYLVREYHGHTVVSEKAIAMRGASGSVGCDGWTHKVYNTKGSLVSEESTLGVAIQVCRGRIKPAPKTKLEPAPAAKE